MTVFNDFTGLFQPKCLCVSINQKKPSVWKQYKCFTLLTIVLHKKTPIAKQTFQLLMLNKCEEKKIDKE